MNETPQSSPETTSSTSGEHQAWTQLSDVPFRGDKTISETATTPEQYQPISEMSRPEMAREYLDLLHQLSSNFTSAEGASSTVAYNTGQPHPGYDAYAGDDAFVRAVYNQCDLPLDPASSKEDNPDLARSLTLTMADEILDQEQQWLEAGAQYAQAEAELSAATQQLSNYTRRAESKHGVAESSKFFERTQEFQDRIAKAQEEKAKAEKLSKSSNQGLIRALNAAYSPDYGYGHHYLNPEHQSDDEYKDHTNIDYNALFFGADNPKRQQAITRALELRKAAKIKHWQ